MTTPRAHSIRLAAHDAVWRWRADAHAV